MWKLWVCTEAVDILGQTVTLVTNIIEKLIYFDEGINANWMDFIVKHKLFKKILNDVRHVLIMCFDYVWKHFIIGKITATTGQMSCHAAHIG